MKKWYVYIVETSLTSKGCMLYTGITTDVKKRIETHNKGKGAKFLRGDKLPVTLKYTTEFENRSEASKEEYRIKQLSRLDKYLLYTVNENKLRDLILETIDELREKNKNTTETDIVNYFLKKKFNYKKTEIEICMLGLLNDTILDKDENDNYYEIISGC